MSKLSALIAGVAVLPVLAFASPATAATYYSNIGGGNILQVKNLSKNGSYQDPTNATCGETVRYRLYLHNAGPEAATNVSIKVDMPTGKATSFAVKATVNDTKADPNFPATADTATVKTDKTASIKYVAGSAEYFDRNAGRLGSLSDSIVTTGAQLPGGVNVSLNNARYVAFNAKLNCETTPPVTPEEPTTPTTPEKPAELVKTGAGDVAAIIAAATAMGVAGYSWFLRRQNAR